MGDVQSEAVSVCLAPQPNAAVDPVAGWTQLQIDVGGIQAWKPTYTDVERNIHSKFLTMEQGDHVAKAVAPVIIHDCNKDLFDVVSEAAFRCNVKHPGNKGQSLYRPTAVVATGYTVPALGDLTAGLLIYARGFATPANNGLKPVAAASVALEIKAAGLVAEAAPPGNATVDVVGVQGAVADYTIDVNGDLLCTAGDFTLMGLQVGEGLVIGGTAANTFFNSLGSKARAIIKTIAAKKITLERRSWVLAGVDAGAGKTIQLFIPRFYRNYAYEEGSDYALKLLFGEKTDPFAGSDGTTRYTYVKACAVASMEISAPLDSKITATINLVGKDATDPLPLANRLPNGATPGAGPGTAFAPLASAIVDTSTDLKKVRLTGATGELIAEVNTWTLTIQNNVTARRAQGSFGAAGHKHGKFAHSVAMEAYFVNSDVFNADSENRSLQWDAFVQNHQFGFWFDLPAVAIRNPELTYAANEPVMLSLDVPAFRYETNNIAGALSVFPFLPS